MNMKDLKQITSSRPIKEKKRDRFVGVIIENFFYDYKNFK